MAVAGLVSWEVNELVPSSFATWVVLQSLGTLLFFMKLLIFIRLLTFSLLVTDVVAQDRLGVVNAYAAQTKAWESGDVLIRIEDFEDSTSDQGVGSYSEGVGYHRFRFDHVKDLFFYYGYHEVRGGIIESRSETPKEFRNLQRKAFRIAGGNGMVRDFPNRSYPVGSKRVDDLFRDLRVEFLNFRSIGFCSFGSIAVGCAEKSAALMGSSLAKQKAKTRTDGSQEIAFELPSVRSDIKGLTELTPTIIWEWDDALLVPRGMSLYESGILNGKEFRNLRWSEEYTWKELGQFVVPLTVRHRMPGKVKRGTDLVSYERVRYSKFHWFSINEGVKQDTSRIDLDDMQTLSALVDPKKSNASSSTEPD
jgi:hypothetical protein